MWQEALEAAFTSFVKPGESIGEVMKNKAPTGIRQIFSP
jgi:hypothetical protein